MSVESGRVSKPHVLFVDPLLRLGLGLLPLLLSCAQAPPAPTPQNPSPMAETLRRHERLAQTPATGDRFEIHGLLPRPVQVFIPDNARGAPALDLLIHFHGSAFVAEQAAALQTRPTAVAVVNLGAGSAVYERPFADARLLPALRDSVLMRLGKQLDRLVLSGFSAGCGAIRGILRHPALAEAVDAIVLLDGVHASYIPEGKRLADGGLLDTARIASLVEFGRRAASGPKRMLVTHSEIFPATYASTTETAEYLSRALELERSAVLEWGPVGMQRIAVARRGGVRIESYAGNTAPDHIDHYHGLPQFLRLDWGGR